MRHEYVECMNDLYSLSCIFQIVCAITEILRVEDVEGHLQDHFARLFAALIVYAGSSVGIRPPKEQQPLEKQEGMSSKEKKAAAKAIHQIKPSR